MSIQWNSLLPAWLTLLLIGALFAALVYSAVAMLLKQVAQVGRYPYAAPVGNSRGFCANFAPANL